MLLGSFVNTLPTHAAWLYPLTMAVALAASLGLTYALRHSVPAVAALSRGQRAALLLGAFCGTMIGAKLPFVLADWEGLRSGAAWFASGKTIVFGIVGGYFGVEITKWALQIQAKTGDSFAVPVAVAVGLGRLGCFVAGCCHGAATALPWGVVFPNIDAQPRHPTQLYEAAFHLALAGVLWWSLRRGWFARQLIKLYLLAYLVFRFGTEFIRPEPIFGGGLTGYQWACLVLLGLFGWLWWRDARPDA
jgi:phosphatidylglycerol:prolipoprotein diacylglycerol transferase